MVAFAATVILIAGLVALGNIWPFAWQLSQPAAALAFLLLPQWLLDREGTSPSALGLRMGSHRTQLVFAVGAMAVVFPLFALGYHTVQVNWLGRSAHFGAHLVERWDEALDDRPATLPPPEAQLALWIEGDKFHAFGTGSLAEPLRVEIELDAPPPGVWETWLQQGALWYGPPRARSSTAVVQRSGNSVVATSTAIGGVRVQLGQARTLSVEAYRGDLPLATEHIKLGRWAQTANHLNFSVGWLWIVGLVLTHLFVVALPEEYFYRGYLQSRLEQLLPARRRLWGAPMGPSLWITSALFALGHYLVELDPARFEVFFPSLLFGWLRARTGGLGAAVAVHGMSNVLLAIISRGYLTG